MDLNNQSEALGDEDERKEESKERKLSAKEQKKLEKKMDMILKSISHYSMEQKINALCQKIVELMDENHTLKDTTQSLERKLLFLDKEKIQVQAEHGRTVLRKARMETLCRELQRRNKSIKEESLLKLREEEEKRKEVATKFQSALNDVTAMMKENMDKNLKLQDDNVEITKKFKTLCDQFKQREDEILRLTKQIELEKQLSEATVKRAEYQLLAERSVWAKEKEHYENQLAFHETTKQKFESNIKTLEDNLSVYSSKYVEFENTISRSNDVFDHYKKEIGQMSKHIQKLVEENKLWKEKGIQHQKALLKMSNDYRVSEQGILERDKKIKQLTDLCRSVNVERSAYLKQLKESGIVPVSVNVNVNPKEKMTKKEAQLETMKTEMISLEKQLSESLAFIKQNNSFAEPEILIGNVPENTFTNATNKKKETLKTQEIDFTDATVKEEEIVNIQQHDSTNTKTVMKDETIKSQETNSPDALSIKEEEITTTQKNDSTDVTIVSKQ